MFSPTSATASPYTFRLNPFLVLKLRPTPPPFPPGRSREERKNEEASTLVALYWQGTQLLAEAEVKQGFGDLAASLEALAQLKRRVARLPGVSGAFEKEEAKVRAQFVEILKKLKATDTSASQLIVPFLEHYLERSRMNYLVLDLPGGFVLQLKKAEDLGCDLTVLHPLQGDRYEAPDAGRLSKRLLDAVRDYIRFNDIAPLCAMFRELSTNVQRNVWRSLAEELEQQTKTLLSPAGKYKTAPYVSLREFHLFLSAEGFKVLIEGPTRASKYHLKLIEEGGKSIDLWASPSVAHRHFFNRLPQSQLTKEEIARLLEIKTQLDNREQTWGYLLQQAKQKYAKSPTRYWEYHDNKEANLGAYLDGLAQEVEVMLKGVPTRLFLNKILSASVDQPYPIESVVKAYLAGEAGLPAVIDVSKASAVEHTYRLNSALMDVHRLKVVLNGLMDLAQYASALEGELAELKLFFDRHPLETAKVSVKAPVRRRKDLPTKLSITMPPSAPNPAASPSRFLRRDGATPTVRTVSPIRTPKSAETPHSPHAPSNLRVETSVSPHPSQSSQRLSARHTEGTPTPARKKKIKRVRAKPGTVSKTLRATPRGRSVMRQERTKAQSLSPAPAKGTARTPSPVVTPPPPGSAFAFNTPPAPAPSSEEALKPPVLR